MKKGVFNAAVEDGKIKYLDRVKLLDFIKTMNGKITIIVSEYKKIRSNDQNRLWWFLMTWAGDELGYTKEEMHDTFRAMFITDRSKEMPVVRSTTTLNTKEMSELYEQACRKLSEMGHPPPEKEELLFLYTNQYEQLR